MECRVAVDRNNIDLSSLSFKLKNRRFLETFQNTHVHKFAPMCRAAYVHVTRLGETILIKYSTLSTTEVKNI
jgi:hypothetical protein